MIPTAELSFQSVVDDYNFLLNRVRCRTVLESKRPLLRLGRRVDDLQEARVADVERLAGCVVLA